MTWWLWVVVGVGLGFTGALAVFVLVAGGESLERRGGLLELDTWEARNALALRGGLSERPATRSSMLRRCNPGKGVHYHGEGDRCECGDRPNSQPVEQPWTPFAGGGDAA